MKVFESLQRLAAAGFRPGTVIDAGAHVGDFAIPVADIYPDAEMLLIDPLDDVRHTLYDLTQERNWDYSLSAVGAEGAHGKSLSCSGRQSSLLGNFDGDTFGDTQIISVTTIDALIRHYQLPPPYLLKMDIQGYELEALKGAVGILPLTPVIVTEVNFVRFQAGMPLFHELVVWLYSRGYMVYELTDEGRRNDNSLRQMNAVFVQEAAGLVDHRWQPGERVKWS